jgi:hypothetical protein
MLQCTGGGTRNVIAAVRNLGNPRWQLQASLACSLKVGALTGERRHR